MKCKVVKEYYRIVLAGKDEALKIYEDYTEQMYYDAYEICAKQRTPVEIERVTVVEKQESDPNAVFEMYFKHSNEYITGCVRIGPPHFAADALGRYNPVNGWVIPEEIETDDLPMANVK